MALLDIKDLHTFFETKRGTVKAVNGVTYSVESGKTGAHSNGRFEWRWENNNLR